MTSGSRMRGIMCILPTVHALRGKLFGVAGKGESPRAAHGDLAGRSRRDDPRDGLQIRLDGMEESENRRESEQPDGAEDPHRQFRRSTFEEVEARLELVVDDQCGD